MINNPLAYTNENILQIENNHVVNIVNIPKKKYMDKIYNLFNFYIDNIKIKYKNLRKYNLYLIYKYK